MLVARAFWGPRPQSVDDGVAAIVATVRGLGDLDEEHFGRWFDPGKTRSDALRREIAADPDVVRAFLTRTEDDEGRVFEEAGWSFYAWNGAAQEVGTLTFNCKFSATSRWVDNRVVCGLPPEWERDPGRVRQALDLVVRAWRPERANVWNADRVVLLEADL